MQDSIVKKNITALENMMSPEEKMRSKAMQSIAKEIYAQFPREIGLLVTSAVFTRAMCHNKIDELDFLKSIIIAAFAKGYELGERKHKNEKPEV